MIERHHARTSDILAENVVVVIYLKHLVYCGGGRQTFESSIGLFNRSKTQNGIAAKLGQSNPLEAF